MQKKRSGPSIEPCWTPIKTGLHDDFCPFQKALWNLPEKVYKIGGVHQMFEIFQVLLEVVNLCNTRRSK